MTDKPAASDGWQKETLQLRANLIADSAAVQAFVDMFAEMLPSIEDEPGVPLLCLALHHVAMRFRCISKKKIVHHAMKAQLENLPEAIYPKERL